MHDVFDPMPRFVVAIPARDEVRRLEACLRALDGQLGCSRHHIVLMLNNCTDGSAVLAERLRPRLRTALTVTRRHFPQAQATAGHARSLALALAADIAGPGGVIATTDADGVVGQGWFAANLTALALGAEAVCGRAVIDPVDALQIAPALHADDAREMEFAALLDEIHGLVDPDPDDPLPRHSEHSGASIAVTVAAYRRAGGMEPLATGEDRGFLRALRRVDARIRHAPEVSVTVSGRLQGRAAGGMADTMARRMIVQDAFLDDDLETAEAALRRAGLRARTRAAWSAWCSGVASWQASSRAIAHEAALSADLVVEWIQSDFFGQAWSRIEAASPVLIRIAVARATLDRETQAALRVLNALRGDVAAGTGDPSDRLVGAEADRR